MADDQDDPVWEAFVTAMLAAGPAQVADISRLGTLLTTTMTASA
jgi:hypothetical protein